MNGRDFVALAAVLSNGTSAAELRTSVSRAYYGAFHVAYDYVYRVCRVNLPLDGACHKRLHQLLESTQVPFLVAIGGNLSSLRDARNKADYKLDLSAPNTAQNASYFLEIANGVVNDVETLLISVADSTAMDAIRDKAAAVFRLIVRP